MLMLVVGYRDRDGDLVTSDYMCDSVARNEIGDLWLHFTDGHMVITKEAYTSVRIFPHTGNENHILAPTNPALMKPIEPSKPVTDDDVAWLDELITED